MVERTRSIKGLGGMFQSIGGFIVFVLDIWAIVSIFNSNVETSKKVMLHSGLSSGFNSVLLFIFDSLTAALSVGILQSSPPQPWELGERKERKRADLGLAAQNEFCHGFREESFRRLKCLLLLPPTLL